MAAPTLENLDAIAAAVRSRTELQPRVALILGSGLGPLADAVESATRIPAAELPGWPVSSVEGHAGQVVLGSLEGTAVGIVQGRVHFYEGYSMQQLGVPVRVMRRLGADTLIVTNAAGGLNPDFAVGDLMLIVDQIFLPGMAGYSPLRGPNLDELGPRFPDMSQPYDRGLRELAKQVAEAAQITLQEGVYVSLAGPAFETPAELRMLRSLGGDAVGMSTAHEVVVARHAGMRTLGFSGITNLASFDGSSPASHQEVLQAGKQVAPKLETVLRGVLRKL